MGHNITSKLKIDSDLLTAAKVYAKESKVPLSNVVNEAIATYLNTMPEIFVGFMRSKKTGKTSKKSLQKLMTKLEAQDIIEALEDLEDITFIKTRARKAKAKRQYP